MRYANKVVLSAADTASQNGSVIDANQLIGASFHAVFGDATAAGTFKLQGSNDVPPSPHSTVAFDPTNWVDIANQSATITSGSQAMLILTQSCYRWLRVVYTRSSGGSTTIIVSMYSQSI